MILEGTIHCEGPDCKCNAHVGADTMRAGRLPPGFLRVTSYGSGADETMGFCSIDCVMKWAAKFPPPETIGLEPAEGDDR